MHLVQLKKFTSWAIPAAEFTSRRAAIQQCLPLHSHLIVPGYGLRYATGSIL
jgi:hypothetical protein